MPEHGGSAVERSGAQPFFVDLDNPFKGRDFENLHDP
jgi:hypothetical protein